MSTSTGPAPRRHDASDFSLLPVCTTRSPHYIAAILVLFVYNASSLASTSLFCQCNNNDTPPSGTLVDAHSFSISRTPNDLHDYNNKIPPAQPIYLPPALGFLCNTIRQRPAPHSFQQCTRTSRGQLPFFSNGRARGSSAWHNS